MTRDSIPHELTPAAAMMTPDFYVSADYAPMGDVNGSYFIYDATADTNIVGPEPPDNGLRVSLDMGRTWSPVHLPTGATGPTVVGSDGNWWYATAFGRRMEDPYMVLTSSDGGLTWQPMTVPPPSPAGYLPRRLHDVAGRWRHLVRRWDRPLAGRRRRQVHPHSRRCQDEDHRRPRSGRCGPPDDIERDHHPRHHDGRDALEKRHHQVVGLAGRCGIAKTPRQESLA